MEIMLVYCLPGHARNFPQTSMGLYTTQIALLTTFLYMYDVHVHVCMYPHLLVTGRANFIAAVYIYYKPIYEGTFVIMFVHSIILTTSCTRMAFLWQLFPHKYNDDPPHTHTHTQQKLNITMFQFSF